MKKTIKWKPPRLSFFEKAKDWVKGKVNKIKEKSREQMQSDEMLDLASKLRLHRLAVKARYLVAGSLVILITVGCLLYNHFRVYRSYRVLSSVERSDEAVTQYVAVTDNRTLKCNPNGVTCVNNNNEVQWNTTFTMQSLIVDSCGSTVVVGDQRGSTVYVFNDDGLMGHFEVEHSLMKVRVAKQGVVAAVLEDGETTWIDVYDLEGNVIVRNKTSMGESGYPMDIAISSDGLKLAVSYLSIDTNDVRTKVAFYNFSSVGQGQSDNLVNSLDYEGQVVPEVAFLDGNNAVAMGDEGLTFFSGRQIPEERRTVKVEQEIISVFHDDTYVGVVTASDEEKNAHKYKMELYRSTGSKCLTKYFDTDYTEIKLSDDEVILYNRGEIEIYTINGKKKFYARYDKQIFDVMKSGGLKYTVITSDTTDKIRIK